MNRKSKHYHSKTNKYGRYYESLEDFIKQYLQRNKIPYSYEFIVSNPDILCRFKEMMDQVNLEKSKAYSDSTVFNDSSLQSELGKKGIVSRWEGVSDDERSAVCSKGGTNSMLKRKKEGTLSDFCSKASKSAWEKYPDKMLKNALISQQKAVEAGSVETQCKSCKTIGAKRKISANHKLNADGKCNRQIMYENLPPKFTSKEANQISKKIKIRFNTSDNRIKVLYKPKSINQYNPVIYCKEEFYDQFINEYENKKTPKEQVVDNLPNGKFSSKPIRELCKTFGYSNYKHILKKYCIKVYNGTNQHDPSLYKKIDPAT